MNRLPAVLGVVICFAMPASADDDRSRVEFAGSGVVCLPLDAEVRAKIASEDLRLVLGISKYVPSGGEATILTSLIYSSDGLSQELARTAMYPGGNFSEAKNDPARRFEIPLRAADPILPDLYAACIRVELINFEGVATQGGLEGYVELVGKAG